jgi:hypothetical protein
MKSNWTSGVSALGGGRDALEACIKRHGAGRPNKTTLKQDEQ